VQGRNRDELVFHGEIQLRRRRLQAVRFDVSLVRLICSALLGFLFTSTASRTGDYAGARAFDAGDKQEREE
jgi:hypothetical protein